MKLQRIIAHIVMEVYGFKSFAKLLRLGYAFFKTESFESFKKRSWTRNFDHCRPRLDFFPCEVFEVQRKPLLSSHLSIVTCCAYTKRRRSHKPLKQVNHFTVKLKTLIESLKESRLWMGLWECTLITKWQIVRREGVSTTTRHAARMPPKKKFWQHKLVGFAIYYFLTWRKW